MAWPPPAPRRAWRWRVASTIPSTTSRSLYLLGLVAHNQGDLDQARPLYDEALALARDRHDTHYEAMFLNSLGDLAAAQNDPLAAQKRYEEALAIWRQRRDKWGIDIALLNLGNVALQIRDLARAGELFGEGLVISAEVGDQARIADYLAAVGRLAAAAGQWQSAARLLERGNRALQEGRHRAVPGTSWCTRAGDGRGQDRVLATRRSPPRRMWDKRSYLSRPSPRPSQWQLQSKTRGRMLPSRSPG